MKIAFGADWVGFEHKKSLIGFIRQLGHEVIDMGGTGIGMSIAANKIPGVRAALCHDGFTAARSRAHNNANILVMGAQVVSIPHAEELIAIWLTTDYAGGRHEPRLEKLASLEERAKLSESYDRSVNPLC
jgi:ribose 5-phosphate isomerase RpiB